MRLEANTINSNIIGQLQSTGLLTGGNISINADNTKYNVSSGAGVVVNNYSNPNAPISTNVIWPSYTGLTPSNLATSGITFIGINSSGAVVEIDYTDLNNAIRDYIFLGVLQHPNLTTITSVSDIGVNLAYDVGNTLNDMSIAIGPINESGNVYSANGANLNINKSAGVVFQVGLNAKNNYKSPNRLSLASSTVTPFLYTYRNGTGGYTYAFSSAVDPTKYDDGSGTLATVTSNKWTIHRIYLLPTVTVIQYGQNLYNSLALAVDGITTSTFTLNPELSGSLLRCMIIVRGGCTALNNTADAVFIESGKFGAAGSNSGTSATTSLQQAYNNSVTPEILTDSTRGALTVKRGSAADTDATFEGLNGSGSITFAVYGNGGVKLTSTTAGLTLPNMTTTQKNAISSPVAGTMVYDTTLNKLCVYTTAWETITSV